MTSYFTWGSKIQDLVPPLRPNASDGSNGGSKEEVADQKWRRFKIQFKPHQGHYCAAIRSSHRARIDHFPYQPSLVNEQTKTICMR